MDFNSWAMSTGALGAKRTPANNAFALGGDPTEGKPIPQPPWLSRYGPYLPGGLRLLCKQICMAFIGRTEREIDYGRLARETIRKVIEQGEEPAWACEADVRDTIFVALQFGLIVKLLPMGPGDFGSYSMPTESDALARALQLFVESSIAKRRKQRRASAQKR